MEFTTEKPPAGEAGMLLMKEGDSFFFKYWDGSTCGEGNLSARMAWVRRGSNLTIPRLWRFVSPATLVAAGFSESEARGMVHKSMLAEAAVDAEWGPWIEWNGGECPIPGAKAGEWQCRTVEGGKGCSQDWCDYFSRTYDAHRPNTLNVWRHSPGCWPIVAYRVKRSAKTNKPAIAATCAAPDGSWHDWHEGDTVPDCDRVDVIRITASIKGATESQIDDVVTTSQYWGPNSFVRKWRPAVAKPVPQNPNVGMIKRDTDGVVCAEPPKVSLSSYDSAAIVAAGRDYAKRQHDKRVAAAAWVERPRDHRLGNF